MRQTVERWRGEGLPAEAGDYAGQWQKSFYDYFGLDWVNFAPLSCHYAPGFEEKLLRDEGHAEVVVDRNGVVLRRLKTSLSMPQFLEYPVKDLASYENMLFRRNAAAPERWLRDRWERWQQTAEAWQAPVAAFLIGFFAVVRELMGVEEGLMAFHTDPELIRRILHDHCDFCIELMRRARERTRVDCCYLWEDMSYKNGMLISPACFDKFIAPEASRFIQTIRGMGITTVIVDSDGDIRELIPRYMGCGVNGFLPFEVQAGMDIRDIRKRHPELIIIGGIDKLAIARGGTALEKEISEKAGRMIEQGRYIPSLDHQAHPEMSLANYRQYVAKVNQLLHNQRG